LGLGKSLTGLGLKKFKKPWAWAYPKKFSTPAVKFLSFIFYLNFIIIAVLLLLTTVFTNKTISFIS
jgi:hypothetical protein